MRAILMLGVGLVVTLIACSSAAGPKRLALSIAEDDVDLASRTIRFKLNRSADSAEVKVFNIEGKLLAEKVEVYEGAKAGDRLAIEWPNAHSDLASFRIELKVNDIDGFWVAWDIVRVSGNIPHEEVVFETGKWEIRPKEAPKLEEALERIVQALEKYKRLGLNIEFQLYVAGHTDTVGSISANRELSQNRARSIAKYLLSKGLGKKKIKIFVRGFGEEMLAVDTGDNVAEERNRRADYIVSNFPPVMPGPGTWRRVQ